jgi:hypothetical protein
MRLAANRDDLLSADDPTGGRSILDESPMKECRHLPTGDDAGGAVSRCGAAVGHARRSDTVDADLVAAVFVIAEEVRQRRWQVECPSQERRHLRPRDQPVRANLVAVQPTVMPTAAMRLMLASCRLLSSSVK